ncbi:VPLPA-CTERM sorting domain-containing protein [Pseudodesulfovibrio sp. zrk46]|uniref:VPLPA-CTERM sorting domain-containing protein n=1 Tax=Pseudodesulfovibrio sp. zrk46 TaxID=2725288 RepID=UPI00144A0C8D|nr:VPLPA-CTERM sorting domain-containing protein [Pseudodesulfovibrio sp. zrk46]QJB55336.1 VPLPA-CTERM sorting domain-containing protein [Pseudodesulfovibrio sp. zrk46]
MRQIQIIFLSFCLLLLPALSHAAYNEVTVAQTYNNLFGTNYSLSTLLDSAADEPSKYWTLKEMSSLQVMAMDTSSTTDIILRVVGNNKGTHILYSPGSWDWSEGTRGYELTNEIDLAATYGITADDKFELLVGKKSIDKHTSRMFWAPGENPNAFLLGFNDNKGGWDAPGSDLNEPILYAKTSATPIPAAAWLLGTGLVGLIGFRRRQ